MNSKTVYKLSDLYGSFIGQTALIIGAGPSLAENIQIIKENREKYVIFAVNKVLRTLIENGIFPDFVVCLDAKFVEKSPKSFFAEIAAGKLDADSRYFFDADFWQIHSHNQKQHLTY